MPEKLTHQQTADVAELEAATMRAIVAGIARAAQWQSFEAAAAAAGIAPARVFGAALAARNAQASRDLATLIRASDALADGTGQLQRWRVDGGPIKWGVKKTEKRSGLGQWQATVAQAVINFAKTAVFSAAAWHIADLFGGAQKVETEAVKLRAENTATCQQTAAQLVQSGHPAEAARLAAACAAADQAAAAPPPGILDSLRRGAAALVPLAGAAASGAVLLALAFLFLSRKPGGGRRYKAQSPIRFHKPATFHKPWREA